MTAAHTMQARRARIAVILGGESIGSQDQLRERLAREDILVTQATLSRDLDAIGAARGIDANGQARYVIRDGSRPDGDSVLSRVVSDFLLEAESAQNIAVLHTPPGGAHYLAGALDRSTEARVVGTVAGDDTVIVVMRDAKDAARLCRDLLARASRGTVTSLPARRAR